MRMRNNLAILTFSCAMSVFAQDGPLPTGAVEINLRPEGPLGLVSISSDQSRTTARGAALELDLHLALSLRNSGQYKIHGVTLLVVTQEATMGGKGSVTIPGLSVAPGDVFPVRIDMRLVRPTQVSTGKLVVVELDGVLYQDLS